MQTTIKDQMAAIKKVLATPGHPLYKELNDAYSTLAAANMAEGRIERLKAESRILLSDHFTKGQAASIKHATGAVTVEEAQAFTDEQLLKVRGIGKIFVFRLRAIPVQSPTNNKHNSPCLDKAGDNEPIFVLRGKDYSTPRIILLWMAENVNTISTDKLQDAFETVKQCMALDYRKYPS